MNEIELICTLPDVLQSQIRGYTPHPLAVVYLSDIIKNQWNSQKVIPNISCKFNGNCIDLGLWEEDSLEYLYWDSDDENEDSKYEHEFWSNNKSFYRKHLKEIMSECFFNSEYFKFMNDIPLVSGNG